MKMMRSQHTAVFLFSIFSYVSGLMWLVLDLLPAFVRNILFSLLFKKFGRNVMLDYRTYVRYPWKVSIGNHVAINRGCEFYPSVQSEAGYIVLEDHVVLGPKVSIFSATHDYSTLALPDTSAPIVIGRHVWIGGNTTLLPGIVIGEGAVIGAGSVVTKDIPPFTVAVGNPAKVIKNRDVNVSNCHMAVNLDEKHEEHERRKSTV